jgi:dihydroorotase
MDRKAFINAKLIDFTGQRTANIFAEDGVITEVSNRYPDGSGGETIDLTGFSLMPGFIDMHAHFREPGQTEKEDMETGMRAALKGGYTTVCGMANTNPVIDTSDKVTRNLEHAEKLRLCNYLQYAAAGLFLSDDETIDYDDVLKKTRILSNDGNPISKASFMETLLRDSISHGFLLATHCEPEPETIERDLKILKKIGGGNLHICHVSRAESVRHIRQAKAEGLEFTSEVTPHHLFAHDVDYRVNPTIGTESDLSNLIEAVQSGDIDILSTDHAPHTLEDKINGANGISNIEVAFVMVYEVFKKHGLSLSKISEMNAYAPAKRLGLKKGILMEGYDADFCVIDEYHTGTLNPETFISKSNNNPFGGEKVSGRVVMSVVGGEVKYDNRFTL